jgi:hypothetical protein
MEDDLLEVSSFVLNAQLGQHDQAVIVLYLKCP